jgi:hypothetical protein
MGPISRLRAGISYLERSTGFRTRCIVVVTISILNRVSKEHPTHRGIVSHAEKAA